MQFIPVVSAIIPKLRENTWLWWNTNHNTSTHGATAWSKGRDVGMGDKPRPNHKRANWSYNLSDDLLFDEAEPLGWKCNVATDTKGSKTALSTEATVCVHNMLTPT